MVYFAPGEILNHNTIIHTVYMYCNDCIRTQEEVLKRSGY